MNNNTGNTAVAGRHECVVRPPHWAKTIEGQQCHCNYCNQQFQSKDEFSAHWKECPMRIKHGYIEHESVPPNSEGKPRRTGA